jgi:hypothetical protein
MSKSANSYVYGVIPAADARRWRRIPGVDGSAHPVRTVVEGDLAALVSDLAPDRTPGRREDLDVHQRVLARAIKRGTTVPMRFGIVMGSDTAVRKRLLARHADELRKLLAELDGRVQMTVKAFYADDALLRDALGDNPDLIRQSAELAQAPDMETAEAQAARARVGEMVAKAVDARRAEVQAALLDELSPLADDVKVEPPSSERSALNAQVLIRRDRRAALNEKVHQLGDGLQGLLAFRYVGPLPPYSFADVSLKEDEEPYDRSAS